MTAETEALRAEVERLRGALERCVELGARSIAYPRSDQKRSDLEIAIDAARAALSKVRL